MKWSFGRKPDPVVPRRRLSEQRQTRNDELDGVASSRPFRRNQTLVGSQSSRLASASELSSHATLQSPRATSHHLRAHRRRLGGYLLAGVAICLLLYGVLYQLTSTVSVSLYGQVGPLAVDEKRRLEAVVGDYLDTYPLERLRLFTNKNRLVAYFASHNMREIAAVTKLVFDGIGRSHVELKTREPIASWTIGSDKRYVDGSGVIFAHNYFSTPKVKIRDESGISIQREAQATAVTSERFLRFIGQAVNIFRRYEIDISTVSIPAGTTRQVDLVIDRWRVKMTVDRPVGEQAEDAARALGFIRNNQRSVKYIDVRVSGRAYYR